MIRDEVGSRGCSSTCPTGDEYVEHAQDTGQMHGNGSSWTLSGKLNMQPSNVSGSQLVRLTLVGGGNTSDFRVFNLYVDPYRGG